MSRSGPAGRLGRLRLSFSGLGVDALLVTHLPNIHYLCGFTGSAGMLLVDSSSAILFTDSRYTFQARQEVSSARVRICKHGLLRAAAKVLRARKGPCRVGYSPGKSPSPRIRRLRQDRAAASGGPPTEAPSKASGR